VKTMAARLKQQYPRENNGVRVVPYHEHLVSNAHLGLLVLLGTVAFVSLIVCAIQGLPISVLVGNQEIDLTSNGGGL